MAVTTRYFGVDSFGTGDASNYTNRTALNITSITVNVAGWSGSFTVGELLIQETSGLSARYVSGTSGTVLVLSNVTAGNISTAAKWNGASGYATSNGTTRTEGWSTYISAFDFTADSLIALIGPGTYAPKTTFATAVFTVAAPSYAFPITLHGCDTSGVALEPPDPDWKSAMPDWDAGITLPVLAITTNIRAIYLLPLCLKMLKITSTGISSVDYATVQQANIVDWCVLVNASEDVDSLASGQNLTVTNCIIRVESAVFEAAVEVSSAYKYINNRIYCTNGAGPTGLRRGISDTNTTTSPTFFRNTIFGFPGGGYVNETTNVATQVVLANNVIANNGSREQFLTGGSWTSTNWLGNSATGWIHNTGTTTPLSYSVAAETNTRYRITYTVALTSGAFMLAFGGLSSAGLSTTGEIISRTTGTGNLVITPTNDFSGSIILSAIKQTGGMLFSTSSTVKTLLTPISQMMITGNANYAIDYGGDGSTASQFGQNLVLLGCRYRDNPDNTTELLFTGSMPTNFSNLSTNSTDAVEYVDAANATHSLRDYRIKNTAAIWGGGYGVADEPAASSSGGGSYTFIG